jgi:hypothetical protein
MDALDVRADVGVEHLVVVGLALDDQAVAVIAGHRVLADHRRRLPPIVL